MKEFFDKYDLLTLTIIVAAFILLVIGALDGCSTASYTRTNPDGSKVYVSGFEIGTDKALAGFSYDGDGKGAVRIGIDSVNTNQTNGLVQLNQLVGTIVEGAVKGAAAGVKP